MNLTTTYMGLPLKSPLVCSSSPLMGHVDNLRRMEDHGAAAVVLMERSVAEQRGYKPLARLVGYSHAAVEPKYMVIGPVPAVKRLLERTGLRISDIDIFEVNEAFAAQALAVSKDLDQAQTGGEPADVGPECHTAPRAGAGGRRPSLHRR